MDNRFNAHLGNETCKDQVEYFELNKIKIEQDRKKIIIKHQDFKWEESQIKELKANCNNDNCFVCVYDIFNNNLLIDYIKNIEDEIWVSYILISWNNNPWIPDNIFNIYRNAVSDYYFIFWEK